MLSKILVPLDGSKLAEGTLCQVEDLARPAGGEIMLLQVANFRPFPGIDAKEFEKKAIKRSEDYLKEVAALIEAKGLKVSTHVRWGDPSREIITHAEKYASLVVMTTHGRGGISRWAMGSVADRVIRKCPKPILIIRADETCEIDWREIGRK